MNILVNFRVFQLNDLSKSGEVHISFDLSNLTKEFLLIGVGFIGEDDGLESFFEFSSSDSGEGIIIGSKGNNFETGKELFRVGDKFSRSFNIGLEDRDNNSVN